MSIKLAIIGFVIKKFLIKNLEQNKEEIIKTIEDKVDLPGLTKEQEKKIFQNLYDTIIFIIISLIENKK